MSLLLALALLAGQAQAGLGGRLRELRQRLGDGGPAALERIFDASAPPSGGVPAPAPGAEDPLEKFLTEQNIPRERWPRVKSRIDALWQLMGTIGVALGDNKALEFRVGEWWMTDTQAGVVFLPLKDIVERMDQPEVLLGGVAHEAGHVFWTRFADLPEFEALMKAEEFPRAVHNLFNVIEDMFQERTQGRMWPGLPFYLKKLHENYRADLMPSDLAGEQPKKDEPGELLPHEKYLEFLRAYWMTGRFPPLDSLDVPEVRAAAQATQDSVKRLGEALPEKRLLSEPEKIKDSQRRFDQIRSDVLPAYKALLKLSEEKLRQQQQGQGQGQGQGQPGKQIEGRSKEIAKKYFPTHGDEDELEKRRRARKQKSVPLDPKQRGQGKPQQSKPQQGEPQQGEPGDSQGEPQPGEGHGEEPGDPIERLLKRHRAVKEATQPTGTYEEHLLALAPLIDAFAGRLEAMFTKNLRPAWEGYFSSGPRPNIKRWMRSESRGWSHPNDFKVFEKRREPTRRDYKFRLLVDLSGSMSGERKKLALRTMVLFMEVLDRLGLDFSIAGFNDEVFLFKDFDPSWDGAKKLPPNAKRELLKTVDETKGGMTHDTEAVVASLGGADLPDGRHMSGLEQQPGEGRYLIVMTDGEGNGGKAGQLDRAIERAARSGIVVIGVGIGEGIEYVQKRYPSRVVEPRVENLPDRIGDLLERIVREGFEDGVPDRPAAKP